MLVSKRTLERDQCDTILSQFDDFVSESLTDGSLSAYNRYDAGETSRLDIFFYEKLARDQRKKNLWNVVRQLLLLSHGQATVERGFSINKEVECKQLSEKAHVARRTIVDSVRRVGGVSNVEITPKLLSRASSAYRQYNMYLTEQKEKADKLARGTKRKYVEDEIESLKKKKIMLQKDIDSLIKKADKMSKDAVDQQSFELVGRANNLRDTANDKKKMILDVEKKLIQQVEYVRNMAQ